MPILTEDMKRVVTEQRLGFYAPAYDDGTVTEEDMIRTFRTRFAELQSS